MRYRFNCVAKSPGNRGIRIIAVCFSLWKCGWLVGSALQSHSRGQVLLTLLLCCPQGVVSQGGSPSYHMPTPEKEKGEKRAGAELTHNFFFQIPELRHMIISSCKGSWKYRFYSESAQYHISSVAQSCPALCNPMDCSTLVLPVHYQLLEFTQTHVHWVGDAI